MNVQELKSKIDSSLGGVNTKIVRETLLIENPSDLPKVARFLKENLKFDYLASVTAADYIQYLESVYHFNSLATRGSGIVLRVRVSKDNPKIPSLVSLYRGAEYQEREALDTYGIVYVGHPDPRRIFMWEGFEGSPMRKDYMQEDSDTLEAEDIAWLDKNKIKVPDEMRKQAEELKKQGKRAIAQKPGDVEPA